MSYGYNAGFEDAPMDEAPRDAIDEVVDNTLRLQQTEYKEAKSLTKKLEAYRADYLMKLREMVTEPKWSRWARTRSKNRNELRDAIAKADPTYEGRLQVQKKRKQIIANGEAFRQDIRLDMRRAKLLRDQNSKLVEKAITKAWKIPAAPTFLLSKGPSANPHPYTILSPPYPGQAWAYYWYRTDEPGYPIHTRYLNSDAGQLGSYTYTWVHGADDYDKAYIWVRTAFRFWYKMPAAGMFELWLKMQAIDDRYWGDTDNEWGFSDVHVKQTSRPYVQVVYPSVGQRRYGSYIAHFNHHKCEYTWNGQPVIPTHIRWAHLLSEDAYSANQWLKVEVGTEEYNYFKSNDVTVDSQMKMKWFVPNIYIRPKD